MKKGLCKFQGLFFIYICDIKFNVYEEKLFAFMFAWSHCLKFV